MEQDQIVNIPKLIYQLLNARVVIEKMCESSGIDLMSETICVLPNIYQLKDSIQRYCPNCKTLIADKHAVKVKKSCPKCKAILKYVCSKCNSKQYSMYDSLRRHWHKCEPAADTCEKLNLVGNTSIDYAREIIRYCSRCNKSVENCPRWTDEVCRNCDHHLLYQCNKCKAQYNSSNSLFYHMRNKCYPSQYKCNQCDFTNSSWAGMRQHLCRVHSVIKCHCPRCDTLLKN